MTLVQVRKLLDDGGAESVDKEIITAEYYALLFCDHLSALMVMGK
jgi:hypothetical protein